MPIPFTQFLMPDGRKVKVEIDRPLLVEIVANRLIAQGCRFEIEMLTTGEVSMEALHGKEEVLASAICPNGPQVPLNVDAIVLLAEKSLDLTTKSRQPQPRKTSAKASIRVP